MKKGFTQVKDVDGGLELLGAVKDLIKQCWEQGNTIQPVTTARRAPRPLDVWPLLTGVLSRRWMLRSKGQAWFDNKALPILEDVQLVALLLTLVVMFALKGGVILESPELIWQMATPLVLFFFVLFFGVLMVSRRVGFNYPDSATTSFHCTGRNFELAIAIALTAFASRPMVGVSTVIGPLIEVPLMLTIVYLAKKSEWRLFGTNTAGACQTQADRART